MAHSIEIRKIPFDFDQVESAIWHPTMHEWSQMLNGASMTMPYLEPFLNRTMRAAVPHLEDEELVKDVDGFVRQEAQHYQNHRRFNEVLKSFGYVDLEDVEKTFEADYTKIEKRSLEWRLAYSAGFETMTMGVTDWLIGEREQLFQNADPTVTSFILWHMVEEAEHKSVAFDVYQAVCGKYWMRVAGLVWGSFHVGFMSRRAYIAMLKRDGVWSKLSHRLKVWRMVGRFFAKAGVAMVRALSPSYHPDKYEDPSWATTWKTEYEKLDEGGVPLVETTASIQPSFSAG